MGRDQLSSLVRQSSDTLHTIFDTDRNQYVDASEVMAAFVMLSKLSIIEKLDFVYQLYDFNGSGELGLDELTMLLRTVAVGCGKMDRAIKAPSTREVEELAKWAFRKAGIHSDSLISRGQFDDFCFYNPTVRNFLDYWSGASNQVVIARGALWVDPAFPPNGRSLYFCVDSAPDGGTPSENVIWLRPKQFCPGSPKLMQTATWELSLDRQEFLISRAPLRR